MLSVDGSEKQQQPHRRGRRESISICAEFEGLQSAVPPTLRSGRFKRYRQADRIAKGGHFYAEQTVFKMTYWQGLSEPDSA